MDVQALKGRLASEGYRHIYEWHDDAGVTYHAHSHKDKVALYIIDGSLTFEFGATKKELRKGDRFDVPAGKEHIATTGASGCTFLVGEMIKGDS